jgi:hypothetical protein
MDVKYLTRKDVRSQEIEWLQQRKLGVYELEVDTPQHDQLKCFVAGNTILVLIGTFTMAKNYGTIH